jgi:pilus assembly protein Flp/PilA
MTDVSAERPGRRPADGSSEADRLPATNHVGATAVLKPRVSGTLIHTWATAQPLEGLSMDKFLINMYVALQTGLLNLRDNMADRDRGATAVEYGLMVALIAGVIVLAVTALGAKVNTIFTTVTGQI